MVCLILEGHGAVQHPVVGQPLVEGEVDAVPGFVVAVERVVSVRRACVRGIEEEVFLSGAGAHVNRIRLPVLGVGDGIRQRAGGKAGIRSQGHVLAVME